MGAATDHGATRSISAGIVQGGPRRSETFQVLLQVFVALRLWDRRLTAEQMQALCRGLATCLPAHPTTLDALEWKAVAEELSLIEPFYSGSQKVRPCLCFVLDCPLISVCELLGACQNSGGIVRGWQVRCTYGEEDYKAC